MRYRLDFGCLARLQQESGPWLQSSSLVRSQVCRLCFRDVQMTWAVEWHAQDEFGLLAGSEFVEL